VYLRPGTVPGLHTCPVGWAWADRASVSRVIKTTFGAISGFPELFVLDATDPAQVKAFENRGRSANTLFIVSSTWGSTLNVFQQYFFELISRRVGAKEAGTAVASSIFGIHSFDQPDVEVSKIATRKLTDAYEKSGALPAEAPIFTGWQVDGSSQVTRA
jgi:glucose-6-phosphate isomerase